jgi:hypothetical protein
MPSSPLSVLAAPSIAAALLVFALAACGTSSEASSCPSPDAAANVDAIAPVDAGGAVLPDTGTDAPAVALGTPGPYFAGTACHCETTTQSQETTTYGQNAQFTNASRSSDGTTCTLHVVTDANFVLTIHSNGVAE